MSTIPTISTERTEGYAQLLAQNFDTVQECYCTVIPDNVIERLEDGQQMALEMHEGQGASIEFGGESFQIWSGGSKGNRWVIENDDLQFHFRTDKPGWNVTVRYKAAGLWEHGVWKLRDWVLDILTGEDIAPFTGRGGCNGRRDWGRLSRVDLAMDFYSPKFSKEQWPGLIAGNLCLTAGVKAGIVFTSRKNETITIGMNRKGVQIQIYDKGKELKDVPGKEWMYEVWGRSILDGGGYSVPIEENEKGERKHRARDVWRVEIRLGKDFLKDRNIHTWDQFFEVDTKLFTEALMRRRMVVPKIDGKRVSRRDGHKERWDLHALWAEAYHRAAKAEEYVPKGRMVTMKREHYIKMLEKQQAGIGRSLSVALRGDYDENEAEQDAIRSVSTAVEDDQHENKIIRALERQKWLDEAE